MTRGRLILVVVPALAIALLMSTFRASPLPTPAPFAGPLPPASPPERMSLYQLPTGVTHRDAASAYRGGSFRDKRDFAMTALLVKHPRGDLLIDATTTGDLPRSSWTPPGTIGDRCAPSSLRTPTGTT